MSPHDLSRNGRSRSRAACLSAALCALLCPTASGQKPPGRVDDPPRPAPSGPATRVVTTPATGAVVVISGIAGAGIELYAIGRAGKSLLKGSRAADADGNATFSALRPGTYRIVVRFPDHDDSREEVRIVAGRALSVTARPSPRFGHVVLAGLDFAEDATVEVDGRRVDPSAMSRRADGSVSIRVAPGRHEIRFARPGYEPYVTESEVAAGGEAMVAAAMERELASVVVKGAVGTRVYVDRVAIGTVPETGELVVPRLVPGRRHELRFELDHHQPLTRFVEPEVGAKAVVDAALEPLPTSGPFEETFLSGLSAWSAPDGWQTARGVLAVRGPGVGIARGWRYADFEMIFGLRLVDPRGAAWVLRARDERNYYLVVLGGPEGRFANQLRTYVVRDGVFDPDAPASAPLPIIPPLQVGETYRVRVRAEGNVIRHWLTPSSTGDEVSIGLFVDARRTLPLGQIGFAAPGGEVFQINGLSVRP